MENKTYLNEDTDFQILLPEKAKSNYELPDPELLQYYRDYNNRNIWVIGEVGSNGYDWISQIMDYNREDAGKPVEERKPIRLIINSEGGDLDMGNMVSEVIKLSITPVIGIGFSMVASAASLIFLACKERLALNNAYVILHRGSCSNVSGTYDQVQSAMADYKKQIEILEKFYTEHTNYTAEEIKQGLGSDWYVRGDELLEKGLITKWVKSLDEVI